MCVTLSFHISFVCTIVERIGRKEAVFVSQTIRHLLILLYLAVITATQW